MHRLLLLSLLLLGALVSPVSFALGLDGHDPVAYFTDNKAVSGSSAYEAEFRGEKYRFSSAANRDAFAANPEKYFPQYGGFCAWAVAQGTLAPGNATVFKVVDGKLYLNVDRDVASRWERDIPGFIRAGDANWPGLRK